MPSIANPIRADHITPAYPLLTIVHWLAETQHSVRQTIRRLEKLHTPDVLATELQQHSLDVLRDLQSMLDISLYPEQTAQLAQESARLQADLDAHRRPRRRCAPALAQAAD